MGIEELRCEYHRQICQRILHLKPGNMPNIADKHSQPSVALAQGIVVRLGYPLQKTLPSGQTAGITFEEVTKSFLEEALHLIEHLRPGEWRFSVKTDITDFDQYEHLADLTKILDKHKGLKAALGEYLIKPDIDCVYHIALPELEDAAQEYGNLAVIEMLDTLVKGKRLRDISDLPFDLAA